MSLMRDEIPDKFKIKDLQECILKIAEFIDKTCYENDITYYLMGGSALGALRHKGFIPWDDDLDIFMKPKDYERFREIFNSHGNNEKFYLQELSERDGLIASAKVRLNGTTYIEEATSEWKIHQGVFVDIFILHNTPDLFVGRMRQCLAAKIILMQGQAKKGNDYTGIRKIAINAVRIFPYERTLIHCLKILYKFDDRNTNYVCHYMGKAFFKEGIYRKSYFQIPRRVQFETIELNIPSDADKYLKDRFGDYMKMPDEDSIKSVQHALRWDVNNDFSKYTNYCREFDQEKMLV